MLKKILGVLGLIAITIIYLFVICACIISSISDEREDNNVKDKR